MSAPTTPKQPTRLWSELPDAPAPGRLIAQRGDLPDGQATMLALDAPDKPSAIFRLLLLRSGLVVNAFVNRCAHFGVPLAGKQAQLIFVPHVSVTCNVHYARYRWSDGVCESGECAGDALIPVPLRCEADGQIFIA